MPKEYVVRLPFAEVDKETAVETRYEPDDPYTGPDEKIQKHLKGDVNLGPRIVEKPAAAPDDEAPADAPAEAAPEKSTSRKAASTTKEN